MLTLNLEGENAGRLYLLELWFFYICLMLSFGWFWFMILPLESSSKETDDSATWRQPVRSPGLGSLGEGWPGVTSLPVPVEYQCQDFGQSPCRPEKCDLQIGLLDFTQPFTFCSILDLESEVQLKSVNNSLISSFLY